MATPINNVERVVGRKVEIEREPYEALPISVHQNDFNTAFIELAQKLRIIDASGKLDPKQVKIDAVRAGWLEFPVATGKPLSYGDIFNSNNPKLLVGVTNHIKAVCQDADAISSMNKMITVNKEREALKLTNFEKITVALSPKKGAAEAENAPVAPAPEAPAAKKADFTDPAIRNMVANIKTPDGSSLLRSIVNG